MSRPLSFGQAFRLLQRASARLCRELESSLPRLEKTLAEDGLPDRTSLALKQFRDVEAAAKAVQEATKTVQATIRGKRKFKVW